MVFDELARPQAEILQVGQPVAVVYDRNQDGTNDVADSRAEQ